MIIETRIGTLFIGASLAGPAIGQLGLSEKA
jgi:hypothetical protein